MTQLRVISNLNHNGTLYTPGQVFDGELGEFGGLVEAGVLEIVGEESATGEETPVEEASAPANTWGPTKSAETTPEAPVAEGPEVDVPVVPETTDQTPATGEETTEDDGANL